MIVLKMFKEKINKEIAEASAIDASFYLCIQLPSIVPSVQTQWQMSVAGL